MPSLPDYPLIYFGGIRWGYAWCFPRQDLRILGICGLNHKSGKLLKRAMVRFLQRVRISPDNVGYVGSHALPYGNYLNQPGCGNVLLVGDACGLADPLLGEGIYYAHKSGQLAASAAIQVGIVLASAAIITAMPLLAWVGGALGLFGAVLSALTYASVL